MVLAAGCTSSPWPAARKAEPAGQTSTLGQQAAGDALETGSSTEAMQEVMAELQQLGALDPDAQATLMEDLRQTDPTLWPIVIQQFRAAVAYRRRIEQRQLADGADDDRSAVRTVSATAPVEPAQGRMARLPSADDAAMAPETPPGDYPATPYPESRPHTADRPVEAMAPPSGAGQPPGLLNTPAGQADWQTQLNGAIRTLESRLADTRELPDRDAEQARLRMLYLLAGRRDDAVRPIASIAPPLQEYWSKQIYSLATWLDTQQTDDDATRAAETKRILEEATARLGESAPLVVRNLAFCTEVQSYGCTKRFKSDEFVPGQEVLLYAEVENFASEPTADGYHTTLRSSYQIFDSRGQRVADHKFANTEETCQNPRRDFFIGYRLCLPNRIYPGKHTLQLTIEDTNAQKVGQSSIELTIKDTDG